MASLLIFDDNNYRKYMLKKALEAENHDVRFSKTVSTDDISEYGTPVEIVLVNWFINNENGWALFNEIREKQKKCAVMLYALAVCNVGTLSGLVKALREATNCMAKSVRYKQAI